MKIRIGATYLEIPKGITFKRKNSFFSNDLIKNHSWPFDLPDSYINRGLLGFPKSIYVLNQQQNFDCFAEIGQSEYKAVLTILSTENTIKANVTVSYFELDLLKTELKDITLATASFADLIAYANSHIGDLYPVMPFQFVPVKNYGAFKNGDTEINADYEGYINQMSGASFVPNVVSPVDNKNSMIPFPFVMHIIKSAFEGIGYSIAGSFYTHPTYQQLLMWSNQSLDALPASGESGEMEAADTWTVTSTGFYLLQSSFTYNDDVDFTIKINGVDIFYIHSNYHGAEDYETGGFYKEKELTLGDVVTLSNDAGASYIYGLTWDVVMQDSNAYNSHRTSIDLKNHMPAMTFGDFLTALKKKLNLDIDIQPNLKTVTIDLASDILEQTSYRDVSDIVSPVTFRDFAKSEDFYLKTIKPKNDKLYDYYYLEYMLLKADGAIEKSYSENKNIDAKIIDTGLAAMNSYWGNGSYVARVQINEPVKSDIFATENLEAELRLFFFHGSSQTGQQSLNNLSLKLTDFEGTFYNNYYKWCRFQQNNFKAKFTVTKPYLLMDQSVMKELIYANDAKFIIDEQVIKFDDTTTMELSCYKVE